MGNLYIIYEYSILTGLRGIWNNHYFESPEEVVKVFNFLIKNWHETYSNPLLHKFAICGDIAYSIQEIRPFTRGDLLDG